MSASSDHLDPAADPSAEPAATGPEHDAGPEAGASISLMGRVFSVVAIVEAITWAGLLVGMFLKYVTGTTEAGVWLFGRLHGGVFMAYVAVAIAAAIKLRWTWWVTLVSLAAAVPPLVTIPLEIWLRRTGRLVRRRG